MDENLNFTSRNEVIDTSKSIIIDEEKKPKIELNPPCRICLVEQGYSH